MNQEDEGVKIPAIADVKKAWEGKLPEVYVEQDSTANGFYFSMTGVMDIHKANHILEIGCGRCSLVPHLLEIKKSECTYLATDLSEKMI